MSLAIIVQARVGSSRLPAKVLEDLGGATVLMRVLERCARVPGLDHLVCAIPGTPDNDPVAKEAQRAGAQVERGSERDVLSRYADAARKVGATEIVRITSDCPFIDPDVCDQTIRLRRESGADYANNTMVPGFPQGLDCEVFPAELLFRAVRTARDPADREHVTSWMRAAPDLKLACLKGPGGGVEGLRWTLDYAEDLAFCRAVYAALGDEAARIGLEDLAAQCTKHPEWSAINAQYVNAARQDVAASAAIMRDYVHPDR